MDILTAGGQLAAILGIVGAMFHFSVLRPLNYNLQDLKKSIDELRADLRQSGEEMHRMALKLVEVEKSARAAHHRLNGLARLLESQGMKAPHVEEGDYLDSI